MASSQARIKYWAPHFVELRPPRTPEQYPLALLLAFTDFESKGDPNVRSIRKGSPSQYIGLLQIGVLNAADAPTKWDYTELETMPPVQAGRRAIKHFYHYMEKYKARHQYDPALMALVWKGGPKFTKDYKRILREQGKSAADRFLNSRWDGTASSYQSGVMAAYRKWKRRNLEQEVSRIVAAGPASYPSLPEGTTFDSGVGTNTPSIPGQSFNPGGPTVSVQSLPPGPTGGSVRRNKLGKIITHAGASVPSGCIPGQGGGPPIQSPGATNGSAGNAQSDDVNQATQRNLDKLSRNYLEKSFYDSLRVYTQGVYVRWRADNGYTEGQYRKVQSFTEEVASGGETIQQSLGVVFADAITSWVKPLVNPVVGNSPWGKKRGSPAESRRPGEARSVLRDRETGELLYRRHFGVDYATLNNGRGKNQPCYSIAQGSVIRADASKSYGLVIYIDHGSGVTSRYAHLSEFKVKEGDVVQAGDVIGITGASEGTEYGNKPGWQIQHDKIYPHLHFELRVNVGALKGEGNVGGLRSNTYNISIDPQPILDVCPNPGEERPTLDPRLEAALGLRSQASALVASAKSSEVLLEAQRVYDESKGVIRDASLSLLGRGAFYENQAKNKERDVHKKTKFKVSGGG